MANDDQPSQTCPSPVANAPVSDIDLFCNEVMCLQSPIQNFSQVAVRDVTMGNITIPAGSRVVVSYGAAERRLDNVLRGHLRLDVTVH